MYINRNYSFWMTFNWSKQPFFIGFIYALAVVVFLRFLELTYTIPWQPVSVIGIAVAFYLGFKNNSSYDRTWEARKIYGGIVNDSRSFTASVISFVQGDNEDAIKKELVYRHIAWLTALRHQLRLIRSWEHQENRLDGLYSPTVCENYETNLGKELERYLSTQELENLTDKTNKSTQILKVQAKRFQELKDQGYMDSFRHMTIHELITRFYDGQGKAERIKNFPLPRQYTSTALWITVVFCALVPFGLYGLFEGNIEAEIICVILSAVIIWIFFLMEKIGDYSENPFEGTYNDVPITSISIGIEIDLREMIDDENIPQPIEPHNGFLL